MEDHNNKGLSESLLSGAIKLIGGLGSFYLVAECFLDQIKYLFALPSVKTAFIIFGMVYAVVPLLVMGIYFSLKWKSKFSMGRHMVSFGAMGMAFLLLSSTMTNAFWAAPGSLVILNAILSGVSLLFFAFVALQVIGLNWKNVADLKHELVLFVPLTYVVMQLFVNTNSSNVTTLYQDHHLAFETTKVFDLYDKLDEWYHDQSSILSEEDTAAVFPTDTLRAHLGVGPSVKLKQNYLESMVTNRWGLFINIFQFKVLSIFVPALLLAMTFLFLLVHNSKKRKKRSNVLLTPKAGGYEVLEPDPEDAEIKFLRYSVFLLIILILPLFHPVEEVKTSFQNPFLNMTKIVQPRDGYSDGKPGTDGRPGETGDRGDTGDTGPMGRPGRNGTSDTTCLTINVWQQDTAKTNEYLRAILANATRTNQNLYIFSKRFRRYNGGADYNLKGDSIDNRVIGIKKK